MRYFAHSGKNPDKSDWQTLQDHLIAVAELAAKMAAPLGLKKAAALAGLFHDLGKYTAAFQKRLDGRGPSVDHSTAGARLLLGDFATGRDKGIAELVAYCIAGHHAGLPNRNEDASCLDRRVKEKDLEPLDDRWKQELTADPKDLVPAFISKIRKKDERCSRAAFQFSVMTRMIFSCLVDADYLDTERFYKALDGSPIDRDWPLLQDGLPQFLASFDAYMASKSKGDTELNRLRGQILRHVRSQAYRPPGLFTLTVPTGGGKTLASLGFALDHARAHGHSRILYASPFTSIVEQTAEIFRGLLGKENVLEHHSAIDAETTASKDWGSKNKLRLAMENWAAPVVVTTNVQFFESLFAAKPSRTRKLHNIANSVILLDEAQTLPRKLLLPCIWMLDELALNYGCSIILCTATQPALDRRNLPSGLPLEGRELAPDPRALPAALRRAKIVHAGKMGKDALVAALRTEEQALVIVNSRKHAYDLWEQAKSENLSGLIHLTTRQYAAHRKKILTDVRDRLKTGKPCRVLATSLIEAGVDVDFPKAWRAEAGLEQIIQAAGRVNREGRRPLEDSIVTVFSAPDYPPPVEIEGLIGDMERMRKEDTDLQSLEAIEEYFDEVYWRVGADGLDRKNILGDFSLGQAGTDFAFREAASKFRMIESGMEPVIVQIDPAAKNSVDQLAKAEISSGKIARELQSYVVQVPPAARDLLIRAGHAAFVQPELRGEQFAVLQNDGLYGCEAGLLWENTDYLAIESSIL